MGERGDCCLVLRLFLDSLLLSGGRRKNIRSRPHARRSTAKIPPGGRLSRTSRGRAGRRTALDSRPARRRGSCRHPHALVHPKNVEPLLSWSSRPPWRRRTISSRDEPFVIAHKAGTPSGSPCLPRSIAPRARGEPPDSVGAPGKSGILSKVTFLCVSVGMAVSSTQALAFLQCRPCDCVPSIGALHDLLVPVYLPHLFRCFRWASRLCHLLRVVVGQFTRKVARSSSIRCSARLRAAVSFAILSTNGPACASLPARLVRLPWQLRR